MNKAILRIQKLKSAMAVRRSLKHAFREQETPNADKNLIANNSHLGAKTTADALQKFNDSLPAKLRKNGVLAVEYLITGSPETMNSKTRQEQDDFFNNSLKWLRERHGAENVFYAGVHRDETTPHLYAYVVPKDEKGNMNARHFFGGVEALSKMQDDFAERVSIKHGLERGVKGSKARHTDIKQYYARVNVETPVIPTPKIEDIPKRGILEKETDHAKKLHAFYSQLINPTLEVNHAKGNAYDLAEKRAKTAENTLKRQELSYLQRERQVALKIEEQNIQIEALKTQAINFANLLINGGERLTEVQKHLREIHLKEKNKREETLKRQTERKNDHGMSY